MLASVWRRYRPEVLLVAVVLLITAPVVEVLMAHQASRIAFTAAIVDHGTIQVDAYTDILQVDVAERDGHLYSDKAPGQPLLAVPFYAAARAAGAEAAEIRNPFDNYTLWWVTLWSATIPAAALAVLMRRFALRHTEDPRAATVAAVGMALGSLLLPFSVVLFSHVLAGLLAFGAYVLASNELASNRRVAVAGGLAGLAVVTEYTTGIVVMVIGVLLALRDARRLPAYVAGGVPAVVLLAVYNTIAWGSPLDFSYDYSQTFSDFHAQGFFGIRVPDPSLTFQVLLGERGLLSLTPVVLTGLAGLVVLARDGGRRRPVGIVGLVVFALFVAVQGGWFSVTAGASPGPRYVVAALPFLAVGVARAWQVKPRLVIATAVVGAAVMLLAIATNPLAQPTEDFSAGHWLWRTLNDRWGDTLLTPFLDAPRGHAIPWVAALALLFPLWRASQPLAADTMASANRSISSEDA